MSKYLLVVSFLFLLNSRCVIISPVLNFLNNYQEENALKNIANKITDDAKKQYPTVFYSLLKVIAEKNKMAFIDNAIKQSIKNNSPKS